MMSYRIVVGMALIAACGLLWSWRGAHGPAGVAVHEGNKGAPRGTLAAAEASSPPSQRDFDPADWVRSQLADVAPFNHQVVELAAKARASFQPETKRRLETEPWIEAWAFDSDVGDIVVARGLLRDADVAICGDRRAGQEVMVVSRGETGQPEMAGGYSGELVTLLVDPYYPEILLGLDNVRERTWIVRPKGGLPAVVPMEGQAEIELEVRRPEKLPAGKPAILEFWEETRPPNPPGFALPDQPGAVEIRHWPVDVDGENISRCDREWFRSQPRTLYGYTRGGWLPMTNAWYILVAEQALTIPLVIEAPEIDGQAGYFPYGKSHEGEGRWKVHRFRGPARIQLAVPEEMQGTIGEQRLCAQLAHNGETLFVAIFLPRRKAPVEGILELIVDARDLPQCGKAGGEGWARRYTITTTHPDELSHMPMGTQAARVGDVGLVTLEMALPLEPIFGHAAAQGQLFALGLRLLPMQEGPPLAVFPEDLPHDFGPADLIYFRLGLAPDAVLRLP